MAFNQFPPASSGGGSVTVTGVYLSTAATYVTLASALAPGAYKFQSDIDSDGVYSFKSSSGYVFTSTMRNGIMLAVFPVAINQISAASTSNVFPIYLEISPSTAAVGAAPTGTSFTWTGNNGSAQVGSVAFTPSSGATNTVAYWTDGTSTSLGSTTSPVTSVLIKPEVVSAGTSRDFILVNITPNGLNTLASAINTGAAPSQNYQAIYTASTTWTAPTGVTSIEALVVAGGGGGAGGYTTGGTGGPGNGAGGGGGGTVASSSSLSVTPGTTYTLTVGAAGNGGSGGNFGSGPGWGSNATGGGNSSLGSLLVATNSTNNAASQSTRGSAGGANAANGGNSDSTGSNGTAYSITGTSIVYSSGGGGGRGGFTNLAGFAGGTGAGTGGSGGQYAGGGGSGSNYGSGGGGGGGAFSGSGGPGGQGATGVIILKWTS
jgi:hypothetical protein